MVATKAGESGNQGVVTHAEPVLPQKPAAGSPPRPVRYNQMSYVASVLRCVWPICSALTTKRHFTIQGIRRFYFILISYSFLKIVMCFYFSSYLSFNGFFNVASLPFLNLPVFIGKEAHTYATDGLT